MNIKQIRDHRAKARERERDLYCIRYIFVLDTRRHCRRDLLLPEGEKCGRAVLGHQPARHRSALLAVRVSPPLSQRTFKTNVLVKDHEARGIDAHQ